MTPRRKRNETKNNCSVENLVQGAFRFGVMSSENIASESNNAPSSMYHLAAAAFSTANTTEENRYLEEHARNIQSFDHLPLTRLGYSPYLNDNHLLDFCSFNPLSTSALVHLPPVNTTTRVHHQDELMFPRGSHYSGAHRSAHLQSGEAPSREQAEIMHSSLLQRRQPYRPPFDMAVPSSVMPLGPHSVSRDLVGTGSRNYKSRIEELIMHRNVQIHQNMSVASVHDIAPSNQSNASRDDSEDDKVTFEMAWNDMLERLKEYKAEYSDCMVPWNYRRDKKLASWVSKQRHYYVARSLSKKRIHELESLGFVWQASKRIWDDMFDRLVKYKNGHGDCLIPTHYKEDPKLGRWVHQQRIKKTGSMCGIQVARLDSIGFKWSVHMALWEEENKALSKEDKGAEATPISKHAIELT